MHGRQGVDLQSVQKAEIEKIHIQSPDHKMKPDWSGVTITCMYISLKRLIDTFGCINKTNYSSVNLPRIIKMLFCNAVLYT